MSAALAVQRAIRAKLVGSAEVTDRVPARNILDRNSRPNPVPSIILGEDQEVEEGDVARRNVRVYATLHVWQKETGLTGVKAIAWAIRSALSLPRANLVDGFHIAGCRVSSSRFMRDPDGEHAHGIVTIEAFVHEAAP